MARSLRLRLSILMFACAIVCLITPALAAGDANAAKGIIVEHCVACHVVPGYADEGNPTVEAPSFEAISQAPDVYTTARLRRSLRQPHWPMTQFRLSATDVNNVLAFIESLEHSAD